MLNITTARKAKQKTLELNMAPLIDMVFILLIFFIVTTSFVKETGVEINRPVASSATSRNKSSILIGINRENRIFLDSREIDIRAVRGNIERALAENPEGNVVIVADMDSSTRAVIMTMDACKLAGAENVSIAASLPGSSD